jgi:hypothetical protein
MFGTVDRLRDAENKSQGLAVANTGEAHIGMRRSSGLYELYEQVLKKEVELEKGPSPSPSPDSDTGASFTLGGKKGKGRAKAKKVKPKEVKAKVSEVANV